MLTRCDLLHAINWHKQDNRKRVNHCAKIIGIKKKKGTREIETQKESELQTSKHNANGINKQTSSEGRTEKELENDAGKTETEMMKIQLSTLGNAKQVLPSQTLARRKYTNNQFKETHQQTHTLTNDTLDNKLSPSLCVPCSWPTPKVPLQRPQRAPSEFLRHS